MNENTLFIGNGFIRKIIDKSPSWGDLYKDENNKKDDFKNYSILYEMKFINSKNLSEEDNKNKIVQQIKKQVEEKFKSIIKNNNDKTIMKFGEFLKTNNFNNIITTNYDECIEFILEICGYNEETFTSNNISTERIYSIRRRKIFCNKKSKHKVILWKIHGDIKSIKSMILGYDHYCGALSKLTNYLKGNYVSLQKESKIQCTKNIREKCEKKEFDNISWAELFFYSNIYFVGFGMSFSEIDIWWILNKRARLILENPSCIKNIIYYSYNSIYDNSTEFNNIKKALKIFNVELFDISSNQQPKTFIDYIQKSTRKN